MTKKIVSVTIERHYSKQATIQVEVDEELVGDELQAFLTEDKEIDEKLEEALAQDSLVIDETVYEYQDPTNNFGGHL
jgi:hypothetical protein